MKMQLDRFLVIEAGTIDRERRHLGRGEPGEIDLHGDRQGKSQGLGCVG